MRKATVDYRQFRISKIFEPQFSHILLLLGWIAYFCMYFLTENLIPAERCIPVSMWLDHAIPFCEWFVIPYVFWYILIVISLGYFLLYNVESFKRLQIFMIIVQVAATMIYIVFPSRQDLRPVEFPRENLLTRWVAYLYAVDTNTGVCPSLHVAISIGIASAWTKEKSASRLWKSFVLVTVTLICLSTVFIKQHSVVDFFAALPICFLAEGIVYGNKYWLPRILSKTSNTL